MASSTVPGVSLAHEALVELIPRLRRYARCLCADATAADDLVQDTLERACTRLGQWRAGSDLRAWLFTIMHNLHVSDRRRPRHRFERPAEDGVEESCDPTSGWDTALDLAGALRALPEAQRQVLLLVAFEDLSYEQVAGVIGVPVGTVMSRLSRARAGLHVLLEPAARGAPRTGSRLRVLK